MKLYNSSLMFNMNLSEGGQPSWGTELGQGDGYRFNFDDSGDFLTGMLYNSIDDIRKVWCPLGKGGNRQNDYEYVLASLFDKIYVNDKKIDNARFVLLIVKQISSDSGNHIGRRSLKYSPKIKLNDEEINKDCFDKIKEALSLTDNAAWFVDEIIIKNQDELHFVTYICDKNNSLEFSSTEERKKYIREKTNTNENIYIGAYNKIYYGAPGCGKSYYVKHTLIPSLKIIDDEKNVVRTTFYQDYSNTDFIGQILPKIENSDVTYEFTPGPFAIALKNALKHRDEPTILIIEEINRGNAASIFGDIFQLLDRKKDGSSEYEINQTNLQHYIHDELGLDLPKIFIPSNLYIIGTMNTSDQNVFTLDTAFKRRWKFEKVKNEFNGTAHDNWFVPGTDGTTWKDLVVAINNYIVSNADEFTNEDKQIGVYFIDENGLVEDKIDVNNPDKVKEFAYKMLEYLWDDVAKFTDKQKWFNNDIKTLDQLIENYEEKAKNNKALEVFGNDLNELINKKSN